MKYSGIGGQAVIEGVMMCGKDKYAVAVRKPDKEIEVKVRENKRFRDKHKWANIPIIRGIVSFIESLSLGMTTLNYSASFFEEEEEKQEKSEEEKKKEEKKDSVIMGIVIIAAVIVAIALFVMLPFFISEALRKVIPSAQLRGLLEGVIRVILFLIYVKLISRMEDIKRVFMYHGAEHKSINCVENGCELTVENVRRQSTQHKRCGTSFLLVVMFVSILFFMFITAGNIWIRMISRLLLIPAIAGVAFEFICFAGKSNSKAADILSKPGLLLQKLTTAEPSDDMIEVAIASVEAVFDWRDYLAHYNDREEKKPEKPEKEKPEKEKREKKKTEKKKPEKKKQKKNAAPEDLVADKTKVSLMTEKKEADPKDSEEPQESVVEEAAPAREAPGDIEILDLNEDEDDEILNALDRYFEAPEEEKQ